MATHAALRLDAGSLAGLRRNPGPVPAPLPISLLKHAEDQSVAGLATVLKAVDRAGWLGRDFSGWGVVAATNFFGRGGIAHTVQRYLQEGAWGISPHLIPHHSLHAISGTVSQVLKIYGPNFGIGGGPNAGLDAFLIASTLLVDGSLPGLWLILTGHENEYIPNENGKAVLPLPPCEAVALALTNRDATDGGLVLRVSQEAQAREAEQADFIASLPGFRLSLLVDALSGEQPAPSGLWGLGETAWVELEPAAGEAQR